VRSEDEMHYLVTKVDKSKASLMPLYQGCVTEPYTTLRAHEWRAFGYEFLSMRYSARSEAEAAANELNTREGKFCHIVAECFWDDVPEDMSLDDWRQVIIRQLRSTKLLGQMKK